MYFDMCKYARSSNVKVNKFKLKTSAEEPLVEATLQKLATEMAPLHQRMAPDSFHNMTAFQSEAEDCRIGHDHLQLPHGHVKVGRPYSGVTAVCDFCAHAHRDNHNMNAGCTVVSSTTHLKTISEHV